MTASHLQWARAKDHMALGVSGGLRAVEGVGGARLRPSLRGRTRCGVEVAVRLHGRLPFVGMALGARRAWDRQRKSMAAPSVRSRR